ncbi:hypothetical protein ACFE04_022791 [Oxalis oulophora]
MATTTPLHFHYANNAFVKLTSSPSLRLVVSLSQSSDHPPIHPKLSRSLKRVGKGKFINSPYLIKAQHQLALDQIKTPELLSDKSILSSLMISYANNGCFPQAQEIWDEILDNFFPPSLEIISELITSYGKMQFFQGITAILDDLAAMKYKLLPKVYSLAIFCLGKQGKLQLMNCTLKNMVLSGFPVDSATGNAFVQYYSIFGSLAEMETAYNSLKRSRILIEEDAIRAVALAYIKARKFYKLGEFLRGVGLGRRNVGNLLWNLLLLSYAANFKMKSLQREFLGMLDAGFRPDRTTFNIRALAFSRMSLFWDLHLSLEHMEHENVVPDLVTYGCVVDAYLDKKLGRNLDFALNRMKNLYDSPLVLTDPFVFEVLGKGDFHSNSEAFLEFTTKRKWTYEDLISVYLKKHFRRNQSPFSPSDKSSDKSATASRCPCSRSTLGHSYLLSLLPTSQLLLLGVLVHALVYAWPFIEMPLPQTTQDHKYHSFDQY